MPATKTPTRPLSELEVAENAVAAAVQKADLAREQAVAAAEAARQRQEERQRQWADIEVGNHAERIEHHAAAVGACRVAFEKAVLSDLPAASAAYLAWVDAMAQRHAAEASFDLARGILGQPAARLTAWPEPSFTTEVDGVLTEVDGVLQARGYELVEASTAAELERRAGAFNGTGQESK